MSLWEMVESILGVQKPRVMSDDRDFGAHGGLAPAKGSLEHKSKALLAGGLGRDAFDYSAMSSKRRGFRLIASSRSIFSILVRTICGGSKGWLVYVV